MTLMTLRINLHRSGAAKSLNMYSAVKIITQAVSKQKNMLWNFSPHAWTSPRPGTIPQGTVSNTFAITDTAIKNPVT